jgi:hypothetical protein
LAAQELSVKYAVHEAPQHNSLTYEVALQGQGAFGILAIGHLHCGAFPAHKHCHLQMLSANITTQQHN